MLKNIDPKEICRNVFSMIGDQWMLITAGTQERCNTMTASWGGMGVLWNVNAATCYIRGSRYTRELVDEASHFTLGFFDEKYKEALELCGSKSGRNTDKIKACGWTVKAAACGAPYFAEAELVLVCKKLFKQPLDPSCIPADIRESVYPDEDYHIMYIGEIVEALQGDLAGS